MSSVVAPPDFKGIQDMQTPFGEYLSGKYKRSFAYITIKDRLPIIITRIIDNISRTKESIIENYGAEAREKLKQVIGNLSELRSELMTNKPLQPLNLIDNNKEFGDDVIWNKIIKDLEVERGTPPTWFNSVWLLSECYMYRRIAQILALTQTLINYDPFEEQKRENFHHSMNTISLSAKYTMNLLNKNDNSTSSVMKNDFISLLKLNLWGNRCDLSLSAGASSYAEGNPVERIAMYEKDLLIDNSSVVWEILSKTKQSSEDNIVDIVCDNAGYELFTDLCVAAFITNFGLTNKIRFYVKRIPWFVSDVTEKDFHWTLNHMKNSQCTDIQKLGMKCLNYLASEQWTIEVESFWTEPFDFSQMKIQSSNLYEKLKQSTLIIFKGDLNYRKLLGDINWQYTTDLKTALRGFEPTNIVTLRTVKADLIVGLAPEIAPQLFESQKDWMTTGQYGLIHTYVHN